MKNTITEMNTLEGINSRLRSRGSNQKLGKQDRTKHSIRTANKQKTHPK